MKQSFFFLKVRGINIFCHKTLMRYLFELRKSLFNYQFKLAQKAMIILAKALLPHSVFLLGEYIISGMFFA